jgi:hypothetical protein
MNIIIETVQQSSERISSEALIILLFERGSLER